MFERKAAWVKTRMSGGKIIVGRDISKLGASFTGIMEIVSVLASDTPLHNLGSAQPLSVKVSTAVHKPF
jgi:hypothetical protein